MNRMSHGCDAGTVEEKNNGNKRKQPRCGFSSQKFYHQFVIAIRTEIDMIISLHCTICYRRNGVHHVLYTWCSVPCPLHLHGAVYHVLYTCMVQCTICGLHMEQSTKCSTHGAVYHVLFIWCSVPCAQHMVQCTMCSTHGGVYHVLYTWRSVPCALQMVQCTVCSTHGAVYDVLYTW